MEGRFLPFAEQALVADPGVVPYHEVFMPGCMTRMCQVARQRGNAGFIGLDLDHSEQFDHRIGYAREIEQRDDGGYGVFRLYEGAQLEKVRSMLAESHTGLSVNFHDVAKPRLIEGVTQRTQIHVVSVAATPMPSYAGAKVLSLRSIDEEAPPVETPAFDEIREWLRSINPEHTTQWDDVDTSIFHAGDCCG
jgi:hypothetical protein